MQGGYPLSLAILKTPEKGFGIRRPLSTRGHGLLLYLGSPFRNCIKFYECMYVEMRKHVGADYLIPN